MISENHMFCVGFLVVRIIGQDGTERFQPLRGDYVRRSGISLQGSLFERNDDRIYTFHRREEHSLKR